MAIPVETGPTFKSGTPKVLFRGTHVFPNTFTNWWRISPNGKRFLMIKQAATTDDESTQGRSRKINIVLNRVEELKQMVPVD